MYCIQRSVWLTVTGGPDYDQASVGQHMRPVGGYHAFQIDEQENLRRHALPKLSG